MSIFGIVNPIKDDYSLAHLFSDRLLGERRLDVGMGDVTVSTSGKTKPVREKPWRTYQYGIFGPENACYWCQCPSEDHGCYMDRDMWEEEFDPGNAEHQRRQRRGTVWIRSDGSRFIERRSANLKITLVWCEACARANNTHQAICYKKSER